MNEKFNLLYSNTRFVVNGRAGVFQFYGLYDRDDAKGVLRNLHDESDQPVKSVDGKGFYLGDELVQLVRFDDCVFANDDDVFVGPLSDHVVVQLLKADIAMCDRLIQFYGDLYDEKPSTVSIEQRALDGARFLVLTHDIQIKAYSQMLNDLSERYRWRRSRAQLDLIAILTKG